MFIPVSSHWRAVDGLRALSVIWMILLHSLFFMAEFLPQKQLEPFLEKGWVSLLGKGHFGVDIFFVISGFLIASLLFREHREQAGLSIKRFYGRRFLRLFPVYAICLFLCAILIKINAAQWWTNVLYVNNFIPFEKQFMGWAWSLAVEWQFYLLFPPFLLFFYKLPKYRLTALFILLGLAFVVQGVAAASSKIILPIPFHPHFGESPQIFGHFFDTVYDKPYNRFGALVCGVIVAYFLTYHREQVEAWSRSTFQKIGFLVSILVFVLILKAPDTSLPQGLWDPFWSWFYLTTHRYFFSMALSFILLFILGGSPQSWLNRFLSLRFWYPVAQISYSAYLMHPIVILAIYFLGLDPQKNVQDSFLIFLPFIFLVTFFLSAILYLFVERPGMNLRK